MIRSMLLGLVMVSACAEGSTALIDASLIEGDSLPTPLAEAPGNVERGQLIFSDRDLGHCVLCHVVDGLDVSFQGDVGPNLSYVADRLSPGQLRLRIVDYQLVRPGTLMPSYYRNHDLYQVAEPYSGDTILTAEQVEDLVAYLSALDSEEDE
ncbi:MAG: sulfur oxidation c-type cytochrome SoxX [Pseudomonadota bacterium]